MIPREIQADIKALITKMENAVRFAGEITVPAPKVLYTAQVFFGLQLAAGGIVSLTPGGARREEMVSSACDLLSKYMRALSLGENDG